MQSEKTVLNWIKEKFPGKHQNIDHLFREDEHFYELCLDYHLCVRNQQRFAEDAEEDKFWIQEYRDLRNDLEIELTSFISKSKTTSGVKFLK